MTKKLLGLMALTLMMQTQAQANPYAPTLNTIGVLTDVMEADYSPFLYQSILGEFIELRMDDSCLQIQVSGNSVVCVSKAYESTAVGTLGKRQAPQEGWAMTSVNWFNNVSVVEKNIGGKTVFSVVVKR